MRNDIVERIASVIPDRRPGSYVAHELRELVAQIACGYEDANDCNDMRHDAALKMAAGRLPEDDPLGTQPTMSRLENSVKSTVLFRIGEEIVDHFIDSFESAPEAVVIDIDPTAQAATKSKPTSFACLCIRSRNYSGSPHARKSVDENGDESGLRVGAVPIVNHSRRRSRQPIPEGDGICRIDRIAAGWEGPGESVETAGLRYGYDVSTVGMNGLPLNRRVSASMAPTAFLRAVEM